MGTLSMLDLVIVTERQKNFFVNAPICQNDHGVEKNMFLRILVALLS